MVELNDELQERLDTLHAESDELVADGRTGDAVERLLRGWQLLPEPPETYDESYHLAVALCWVYLSSGELAEALRWANTLQSCDLERIDDGDREFMLGVVHFEMNDLARAAELFQTANVKSEGYCFEGEDPKYRRLLRG